MTRIRNLVLHVGLHHSGAALLGQSLIRLRPQLHHHGVALLTDDNLTGLARADGWMRQKDSPAALAPLFDGQLRVLAGAELDSAARSGTVPRTLLITSEHLTGGREPGREDRDSFRPYAERAITQAVEALEALEANRIQLVLYTRRQDRLMECSYVSAIQRGKHHSFSRQFPTRNEPVFSYDALATRLLALPGITGIRVRPYEMIGAGVIAFVDDFLSAIDLGGRLDLSELDDGPHESSLYCRRALHLALDMNPHLETERERELVREFLLAEFPSTAGSEARFLSRKVREQIITAHRADNISLFASHMPDLPSDSYGSLEATRHLEEMTPPTPTVSPSFTRRVRRAVKRRLPVLGRLRSKGS